MVCNIKMAYSINYYWWPTSIGKAGRADWANDGDQIAWFQTKALKGASLQIVIWLNYKFKEVWLLHVKWWYDCTVSKKGQRSLGILCLISKARLDAHLSLYFSLRSHHKLKTIFAYWKTPFWLLCITHEVCFVSPDVDKKYDLLYS